MVAGATGIDLFLLVVAADDGVMPQTREHSPCSRRSACRQASSPSPRPTSVAAEGSSSRVEDVARRCSRDGPYAGAGDRPGERADGRGPRRALRAALDRLAARMPGRRGVRAAPARLHVDRSFTLKGIGTVVTGHAVVGRARRAGRRCGIEPRGRSARVRSLQVHDRPRRAGRPPGSASRSTSPVSSARRSQRGDVVTEPARDAARRPIWSTPTVALLPGSRAASPRDARPRSTTEPGRRRRASRRSRGRRSSPARGRSRSCGSSARSCRPRATASCCARSRRRTRSAAATVVDPTPAKARRRAPTHVERLRALASGDPLERLAARAGRGALGPRTRPTPSPRCSSGFARPGERCRSGSARARWFSPDRLAEARRRGSPRRSQRAGGRPASRGALADAAGLDERGRRGAARDARRRGRGDGRSARASSRRAAVGARRPAADARCWRRSRRTGSSRASPEALAGALGVEPATRAASALERLALGGRRRAGQARPLLPPRWRSRTRRAARGRALRAGRRR